MLELSPSEKDDSASDVSDDTSSTEIEIEELEDPDELENPDESEEHDAIKSESDEPDELDHDEPDKSDAIKSDSEPEVEKIEQPTPKKKKKKKKTRKVLPPITPPPGKKNNLEYDTEQKIDVPADTRSESELTPKPPDEEKKENPIMPDETEEQFTELKKLTMSNLRFDIFIEVVKSMDTKDFKIIKRAAKDLILYPENLGDDMELEALRDIVRSNDPSHLYNILQGEAADDESVLLEHVRFVMDKVYSPDSIFQ